MRRREISVFLLIYHPILHHCISVYLNCFMNLSQTFQLLQQMVEHLSFCHFSLFCKIKAQWVCFMRHHETTWKWLPTCAISSPPRHLPFQPGLVQGFFLLDKSVSYHCLFGKKLLNNRSLELNYRK